MKAPLLEGRLYEKQKKSQVRLIESAASAVALLLGLITPWVS
jgi:hypothetical protein